MVPGRTLLVIKGSWRNPCKSDYYISVYTTIYSTELLMVSRCHRFIDHDSFSGHGHLMPIFNLMTTYHFSTNSMYSLAHRKHVIHWLKPAKWLTVKIMCRKLSCSKAGAKSMSLWKIPIRNFGWGLAWLRKYVDLKFHDTIMWYI